MRFRLVSDSGFSVGDLVKVKTMSKDENFCIIGFKYKDAHEPIAVLKALFNETYIIDKPVSELMNLLIKGQL